MGVGFEIPVKHAVQTGEVDVKNSRAHYGNRGRGPQAQGEMFSLCTSEYKFSPKVRPLLWILGKHESLLMLIGTYLRACWGG